MLGNKFPSSNHIRILDQKRNSTIHKHRRTQNDTFCNTTPHKRVRKPNDQDFFRQHNCPEIHHKVSGNNITNSSRSSNSNTKSLQQSQYLNNLPTHPISPEHPSRHFEQNQTVTLRIISPENYVLAVFLNRILAHLIRYPYYIYSFF